MPRRSRMYIAGLPYQVVQRGNNREACFIEPENYQYYLALWEKCAGHYGVTVHACCLMTNPIHFLATHAMETAISDTLKVVGSRYAQYINKRYRRTGTMWEGRHRSSLVQSDLYLLTCMHYIELNPVRAGMVTRPEAYCWSSYGVNAWGDCGWIRPYEEYLWLSGTLEQRCHAYRGLFRDQLSSDDLHGIREAVHYCQPLGDDRFRRQIEEKYAIKPGQMKRGRPKTRMS